MYPRSISDFDFNSHAVKHRDVVKRPYCTGTGIARAVKN